MPLTCGGSATRPSPTEPWRFSVISRRTRFTRPSPTEPWRFPVISRRRDLDLCVFIGLFIHYSCTQMRGTQKKSWDDDRNVANCNLVNTHQIDTRLQLKTLSSFSQQLKFSHNRYMYAKKNYPKLPNCPLIIEVWHIRYLSFLNRSESSYLIDWR